jgi:hypothetical protein
MNSREILKRTLNHQPVERVCVDFGATAVTGISASTLSKLRRAVIKNVKHTVRVNEPYQMLGEIDPAMREWMGIDVAGVFPARNMFGFENKNWKPFTMFDGTEVEVPGDFNLTSDGNGGWYIHPEGDISVPPSGHMPKNGFYFDAICRQEPIDESKLNPADNLEEFGVLSKQDIQNFARQADAAVAKGLGTLLNMPGTAFGDIAIVPALWRKRTRGIRDVEEWYVSTAMRKDYVKKVFEGQCEIALENLALLIEALGDKIQVIFTTGTDFGTQTGLFISPNSYREQFKPFHKIINDYIHKNSNWKIFIHSCGAVRGLIPDFIDAGFDVLNPVQCSAVGMEPKELKKEFGKDIVFWGGGIDTQQMLPFGKPYDVYRQTRERIEIFNQDGGFVFNGIHNIQANIPVENVLAMFRAVSDCRRS